MGGTLGGNVGNGEEETEELNFGALVIFVKLDGVICCNAGVASGETKQNNNTYTHTPQYKVFNCFIE